MTKYQSFGVLMSFVVTWVLIFVLLNPINHNTLTIYTSTDILYVNGLHITSETGQYDLTFDTNNALAKWLENTSARMSEVQNYEIVSLATDHSSVILDDDGVVHLKLVNPYVDFEWNVRYNASDTVMGQIIHYYQD